MNKLYSLTLRASWCLFTLAIVLATFKVGSQLVAVVRRIWGLSYPNDPAAPSGGGSSMASSP